MVRIQQETQHGQYLICCLSFRKFVCDFHTHTQCMLITISLTLQCISDHLSEGIPASPSHEQTLLEVRLRPIYGSTDLTWRFDLIPLLSSN